MSETAKETKGPSVYSPDLKTATKDEKERFIKILDRRIAEYERENAHM